MVFLAINNKRIEVLPLDSGEVVWSGIEIEKVHRDSEGAWIGLRKSLLDAAIKGKVKLLNIRIKELDAELDIPPEKFKAKAKTIEMPSKYFTKPYQIYLYPVSDLMLKKNEEGNNLRKV